MPDLTAADVLEPSGEIDPVLFPDLTDAQLATRLEQYIAQGYQRVDAVFVLSEDDRNAAARLFVAHRAYAAVYAAMLASPTTAKLDDQGSIVYTQKQIDAMKALADTRLQEFEAMLASFDVTPTESFPAIRSWRSPDVRTIVPNSGVG